MSVIERELVRAINSGRCFALVGAGASCEIGLPAWRQLAQDILESVSYDQKNANMEECRKLLDNCEYAKFFGLMAEAIGRDRLLTLIQGKLSGERPLGRVYQYISSWPFQSYLTTNYDDQLERHLQNYGLAFVTRWNSKEDMQLLHSNVKDVVFKIHGDLSHGDVVLTDKDYLDFQMGKNRQYWRDSILSLLKMVDLVLIGYSASDPDFKDQLERVKDIVSPDHPIFMFATGIDIDEVREYYRQRNIHIVAYSNDDGTHRDLRRVLARYDPFIAKRGSSFVGLAPIDTNTATLASSIHLFTQLRVIEGTGESCFAKSCAAVVLQRLSDYGDKKRISISALLGMLAEKTFAAAGVDPVAVKNALEYLRSRGLISLLDDGNTVVLEPKGISLLRRMKEERALIQEKYENSCHLFLEREYTDLDQPTADRIIGALTAGLIRAFQRRGMEIARSVFANDPTDISDATDILDVINRSSEVLGGQKERAAFADLMLETMLKPNEQVKEYLGLLCQGYFAYHALGLEPRCSEERLNMARETVWILDSSIILPLLALDSLNHNYAKDLLERMRNAGLRLYTTEHLFDEVHDHAVWAISHFTNVPYNAPEVLQAAMAGPGYKQNLFLDGFIKWGSIQGRPTLGHYMSESLGEKYASDLRASVRDKVTSLGIEVRNFPDWPGFSQEAWAKRDAISQEIANVRRSYGTYTGTKQCDAEAEVVMICDVENATFLSQSGVLNRISKKRQKISWKPESMYRFLTLFSSVPSTADLLYECMTQDFFYAGFDVVNTQAISHYVAPMVRQSRMALNQERQAYRDALGTQRAKELEDEFERIPDEQKPFYSMQFAFYVARQEGKKRQVAEDRAKRAEEVQSLTSKERKEYQRLKAKQEQRRRKQVQQKRRHGSRHKK